MRRPILLLLALAPLPLSGCVAGIAAGAVGAAVRAADQPDKPPSEDPAPAARAACSARAAPHGDVKIIDVIYRSAAKVVVWGSVESGGRKRSFQCRWDGKIVGFEMKAVGGR
ncbi:MAG TPA: hypothetical protein VFR28_08370 [Allosphingosinicella sp.]|jgi:hypothetical protein|nr:hypothetical protein [Allosphingosinicella sp.]